MRAYLLGGLIAGVLLLTGGKALAHHSFAAEFDGSKCRDFTGTLTKVEWANPHGFFYVDIKDPDGQGRVKISLPWSADTGGARYENWARLATFMAGNNRGSWFIPDVNDEVLVVFENGDPRRP